ncbi:hypothetical protein CUMW_216660 [Citrus unshiu]|uniref:5MP1/2-like HEAT domain-containing protein n=1 Tax=Citrus unshiu TaxID=55188 RepID=A0A2H5QCI6_CITUN|nr:hypothetical protein CUMW_216660 [Citrus unshiu]
MSSKEKPTLGGTRIKPRKRNIAAPLDPAAFSDAVVQIYLDNAGDLELIAKCIESSDLNFSRYETVFQPLLKDNLVGKGLVLSFITDFFKEYLVDNSLDDLIAILKRGKMEDNLLDFFPSSKRSAEGFSEHFTKEGLIPLVEYNEKKIFEVKLKDMKSTLTTQIAEETEMSEVIESVKQRVKDAKLPDIEVVRILWDILMDAVQWSGKNQQQNANAALRQVSTKSVLCLCAASHQLYLIAFSLIIHAVAN